VRFHDVARGLFGRKLLIYFPSLETFAGELPVSDVYFFYALRHSIYFYRRNPKRGCISQIDIIFLPFCLPSICQDEAGGGLTSTLIFFYYDVAKPHPKRRADQASIALPIPLKILNRIRSECLPVVLPRAGNRILIVSAPFSTDALPFSPLDIFPPSPTFSATAKIFGMEFCPDLFLCALVLVFSDHSSFQPNQRCDTLLSPLRLVDPSSIGIRVVPALPPSKQ